MGQVDDRAVVLAHRDSAVRQIVRAALESRGVMVHTTRRGEEAIRLVQEWNPGAVLISLELENVSGWQVAKVLRESGSETPIIAVTADARSTTRGEALESGFTDYWTLPVNPFELARRLAAMGIGPGEEPAA